MSTANRSSAKLRLFQRTALSVGILVALPLLYVLAASIIHVCSPRLDHWFRPLDVTTFTTNGWIRASMGDGTRYRMGNYLVWTKRLIGRPRNEIVRLLGDPTYSYSRGSGEEVLCYGLAPRRDYPARSRLFPFVTFWNVESWILDVRLVGGNVYYCAIRAS